MKNQFNSNKMLLTTALLAVLGANYTFQQNSIELNRTRLIELSSNAPADKQIAAGAKAKAKIESSAKPAPEKSDKAETKLEAADLSKFICESGLCPNVAADTRVVVQTGTIAELVNKLVDAKLAEAKSKVEPVKSEEKVDKEDNKDECNFAKDSKKESRSERKEREECEFRKKGESLEEDFKEAMDSLKDRCESRGDEEIQCLTEGYTKELKKSKYYGKGKKEYLADSFAKSQLRDLVGSKLSKALDKIDPNDNESLEKIKNIVSGMMDTLPESYGLKTLTLNSFKSYMAKRANSVVALYTQARTQDKNNPQAAIAARSQAYGEAQEFTMASDAIIQGIQSSNIKDDSTAYKYYNSGFLPDIRKMFLAVNNPIAKDIQNNPADMNENTQVNQNNTTTTTTTRNANRGGQVVQQNGQVSGKVGYDNYQGTFSTTGAGQAWQVQQPTGNVNVGTVSVGQPSVQPGQSNRGTRNGGNGTVAPAMNRQGGVINGLDTNF